jgi:hypothetical protein
VFALSDHGQQAFITALAAKRLKANDLKDLSKAPDGEATTSDHNSWDRTMVVAVSKGSAAGPADRLIATKVVIRPLNFAFTGYTVVATDTKTIDVAHLETDLDRSLTGEIDPTLGPLKAGKLGATIDK